MEDEVYEISNHFSRFVLQPQVCVQKLLQTLVIAHGLFLNLSFRRVQRAVSKFSNYSLPVENKTNSQKLYDDICAHLPSLVEMGRIHTQVSRASAMTQLIAFIILLDGRKEWTPELYGEMAELFSSISNVESADVPVALKVTMGVTC